VVAKLFAREHIKMESCILTVVMPAYNEEDSIALAVEEVQIHILNRVENSELIVVDDGSRDSTPQILQLLSSADHRIRVLHQENGGHGKALLSGLHEAHGKYLFLLDSDRQIPAEAFDILWEQRDGSDGIMGVRASRRDPWIRLCLSRMIYIVILVFFQIKLADANCPFKLLRRTCWEKIRPYVDLETMAPSLFLAILMKRAGMRITEAKVPHQRRTSGTVSIRRLRLLSFCWKGFWQMAWLRRRLMGNERISG
jgi:dolichol-phosphate mannosyltransferase